MANTKQIKMVRYIQPSGVAIRLRLLQVPEGLGGHPYTAERLVGGHKQEWWLGWPLDIAERTLESWEAFEERIGSKLSVKLPLT